MKKFIATVHLFKDTEIVVGEAWEGDNGTIHFDLHTLPTQPTRWNGRILLKPEASGTPT